MFDSSHKPTFCGSFSPLGTALLLLYCCAPSLGQEPTQPKPLFSSSVGQEFCGIGYELGYSRGISPSGLEQAITLMTATAQLDPTADYYVADMIRLVSRQPDGRYAGLIYQLLLGYVGKNIDLEVTRQGISYLLAQQATRERKEQLFAQLLKSLGGKNKVLDSELATQLGLLMAEKPDAEAAKFYFLQAYNNNRYNRLAFAKLVELLGDQIKPPIYLEHLRLALNVNPLDMENALAFANYCDRLQLYETAADAYRYCAELYRYTHASDPLPATIYLPWAVSCYNTERDQNTCLQIASEVRQGGRFDLLLEAVAGRAAVKTGNSEEANRIFRSAEAKATTATGDSAIPASEVAWFYCFGLPDVNQAIEWANKAYSPEPSSPTAASLLAYALVMDGKIDLAKLLIESYKRNQIAELAFGRIQLAQGQKSAAIETLKAAIEKDPGSLAAEQAKKILAEQGVAYVPAIDPGIILNALTAEFGQNLAPQFRRPEQIVGVDLKLDGSRFLYGSNLEGNIVITNHSSQPLVVSEEGLVKGYIRVDADVTGDMTEEMANLLSMRVRPASPIDPSQSIFIPVRLAIGPLRKILLTHPQASLDIRFTIYLDPEATTDGGITNRFGIEPGTLSISRPGVELSRKYLQNRLDSLSKGQQGQKIKSVQLFAGLLEEHASMAGGRPLYKYVSADWMPGLLRSALAHSLTDDNWVVKVHTMVSMLDLSMDYELTDAVSANLTDSRWPCRLTAIFLLSQTPGANFRNVLDWTAKYDSDPLVRQMAVALGGRRPEPEPAPQNAPAETK